MDVVLVHNPNAGVGTDDDPDLEALIRDAGHSVTSVVRGDPGWQLALERCEADLVAIAGGDGTVGDVFTEFAGTDTTLAVIPTGTANNIARTLRLPIGDPEATIDAWSRSQRISFTVPVVGARSDESRFVESFGGGLFTDLLRVADRSERLRGSDMDTEEGLRMLRALVIDAPALTWEVTIDGDDRSASLIAVEVMNIRGIGPNVRLAPSADPSDGQLDVVLIGEDDRVALVDHVDRLLEAGTDRADSVELPLLGSERGRLVRLVAPTRARLHVDDEPWRGGAELPADDREIYISQDGTAVDVLAGS